MKKQPTILQVLPSLKSGGVERGTVEMVNAIAKRGWKALVASAGGPLEPHVRNAGGEHITLPLHSKNPIEIWSNIPRLEKVIHERQVDIVHARSRAPAWSAYYAARSLHVAFVTTFHGTYGTKPWFKKYYNRIMLKG